MNSIDFLTTLVSAYSPSRSETPAAECAKARMIELGYSDVQIDTAGNVIGHWGNQSAQSLLLLGHIDTVPGEIEVKRVQEKGTDVLYGRGSVDAKGPFATFVESVARLPQDLPYHCIVVGVVEEEVASSKGARFIGETLPKPDLIIIGEPSGGDGITLGYKGRLVSEVSIAREMDHSASKSRSVGDLLVEWGSLVQAYTAEENGDEEKGFSTLDEKVQRLSVVDDQFIEKGEMEIGFRVGPDFEVSEIEEELLKRFKEWRFLSLEEGVQEIEMKFTMKEPPAVYAKNDLLPKIFRQAIRKNSGIPRHVYKTGTSDMNVLSRFWDTPMIAYGPGDSDLDHTPNEHIDLIEYELSIDILHTALQLLAAKWNSNYEK